MTRKARLLSLLLIESLIFSGCASGPTVKTAHTSDAPNEVTDFANGNNKEAPNTPASTGENSVPSVPLAQVGNGIYINRQALKEPPQVEASANDTISLNFVNADIRDVARVVLKDMFSANVMVDPSIQGAVTLQTSEPIPRDAALSSLEAALAFSGVAMVRSEDGFRVVPRKDALRQASGVQYVPSPRALQPGFGIQIVPVHHVSVDEMLKILQPFAPQDSIISTDRARNLFVLAGTSGELDVILNTIALFDVDRLADMSFEFIYPKTVDADRLAEELSTIWQQANSSLKDLVQLIPISRLNALLVLANQPDQLHEVKTWIARLDLSKNDGGRAIHIYRVQHGKAADLADSVSKILQMGTGGSSAIATSGDIKKSSSTSAASSAGANGGSSSIVADEKANAIMFYGDSSTFEVIRHALEQLDLAPDQVMIEAAIVEVGLTNELRYGVQWFFKSGDSQFTLSSAASGAVASVFPGFSYTYTTSSPQVALNALESITKVNVVSSPKILVLNNQMARLQVGDEVPVATQSAVSVTDPGAPIVNTIQFRDTGVILEVVPRVNQSGSVLLEINQEVSDVAETKSSGIDSPTIQQRKFQSTVLVDDGQTIALGGLIRDNKTKGKSGLPLLQRIPLLGSAFRSTTDTNRRTELLIFITPHVIRNMQEARDITDYLKERLRSVGKLSEKPH